MPLRFPARKSTFCEHEECLNLPETTKHFFLECPKFTQSQRTMLRGVADLLFPGVNYNNIIGLLGDHL